MSILRNAFYIAAKDIKSEAKSKQVLPTMLIFAAMIILIFSFAFDPSKNNLEILIPGLIWVITIFAGIIGLNRSFVSEQKNDNIIGLMLAPVNPISVYIGKFISNLSMILIVQAVSIPILFLLFGFEFEGSLVWFIAVLFIGSFGFACVGTFLAALASNSGTSEMLLPILLFPITIPVLIGVVEATRIILLTPEDLSNAMSWMQIITGYDILFFGLSIILFEYLMEV